MFYGGDRSKDFSCFVAINGDAFYQPYRTDPIQMHQWVMQWPAGGRADVEVLAIGARSVP
jgi:hypothetical protein